MKLLVGTLKFLRLCVYSAVLTSVYLIMNVVLDPRLTLHLFVLIGFGSSDLELKVRLPASNVYFTYIKIGFLRNLFNSAAIR